MSPIMFKLLSSRTSKEIIQEINFFSIRASPFLISRKLEAKQNTRRLISFFPAEEAQEDESL